MNARERFQKTLNFEKVDRLPMIEWAVWWDKTIDNWKEQGLVIDPIPDLNWGQGLQKHFGLDLNLQLWVNFTTAATPKPSYHGAPIITSMQEYEAVKPTLYPDRPFDRDVLKSYSEYQKRGEGIVWFTLDGTFWGPRVLMGIEPHLYGFYDEPELMHTINEDLTKFNLRVIDQITEIMAPDFMTFAEDMSYNNGPMISETLFDEFMLPYYKRMIPPMKQADIRVFVDSDGDIERALPWFQRAGIEGIAPLERQAGVDLERLRKTYPKFLFIGHFDKMTMPKGEKAMRAEFERLLPVMKQGGFVPSVDHQTPPGVTLENYKIYLRLLREYAEKAC